MFSKSRCARFLFVIIVVFAFSMLLPTTVSRAAGTIDGTNCNFATLQTFAESGGVVNFTANCTITFTGTINITIVMGNPTHTTINANGHTVVFNGNGNRMFAVDPVSSLTINGITLQNGASAEGGAIYGANGSGLTVNNSTFSNNTATSNGGAIFATSGVTLSLTNVTFSNNMATNNGGAIYALGGVTTTLTNVTFTNNIATNNSGGAIYADGGSPITVSNATFTNNSANATSGQGGAIYGVNGSGVNGSNLIIRNSSAHAGGAIYAWNGAGLSINGLTLTDNTATTSGGGIVNFFASSIITNAYFANNVAGTDGGAISVPNGAGFTVRQSSFVGNRATGRGGVAFADNGPTVTFENTIFYGNNAAEGGVLYAGDAGLGVIATHNTFANNTAGNGVIIVHGALGYTTLTANIIQGGACAGNIDDDGNNIAFNASGCPGMVVDPQLGALTANGLLIPAETSPAIDAYSAPCDLSTDRLNRARPFGDGCDVGALEVRPEDYILPQAESPASATVLGCVLSAPNGVGLANAPDNTYCTLLMQNGAVVNYLGAVPQNLIDAGVLLAVEIYQLEGGISLNVFPSYARVCLAGSGRLLYMDGRHAPRFAIELTTERVGNSTCGWIPAPGTLILIRG